MIVTSAASSYGNVYGSYAAKPRQETAGAASAASEVSISNAAREAAKNDQDVHPGYKLPDYIAGWFNKDFPPDVVDEARARLDDIKANGEVGAGGPMNLPLLPENQKLLDSFRQEMNSIRSAGWENATPAQAERLNLLMNLSMRVQLVGWKTPMTEADAQREFDVANLMAKMSANDPVPAPGGNPETNTERDIADMRAGAVPAVWRQRWQKEGLPMPENVTLPPGRSLWLDMAQAAGIGEEEFLSKAREMAASLKGHALTQAIEGFISERYTMLAESRQAQSA
jgi:hypothetical protein